jgi:hypothetical protein
MSDESILIGPLLDELNVRLKRPLRDNEHITEVLVLMKTKDLDGDSDDASILLADSDLDWVQRRGLMGATAETFQAEPFKDA